MLLNFFLSQMLHNKPLKPSRISPVKAGT